MIKNAMGQLAKDKITGFEGVITGHADYITGCDQYLIQPKISDGKVEDARWFDEARVDLIKMDVDPKQVQGKDDGADLAAPIK